MVTKAHTYFNQTPTNATVDMDRESAIAFLNDCYDSPCPVRIEKYLAEVGELRREVSE